MIGAGDDNCAQRRLRPAVDMAFLRMDRRNTPMHTGCLLTFALPEDAPPDFIYNLVVQLREQPVAPPFDRPVARTSRVPGFGGAQRAGTVDMDFHIRHSALPRPGGERELGVLVARLQTHAMDLGRPLWELHVVEGLENARFAIYLKVHRCLGDTSAVVAHLERWLSDTPHKRGSDAALFARPASASTDGAPASVADSGRGIVGAAAKQLTAARELGHVFRQRIDRRVHSQYDQSLTASVPRTPFNDRVTAQRRLATQVYAQDRFVALCEATGASVDAIALAIAGGAIRRYLMEYNALPKRSLVAGWSLAAPHAEGAADDTALLFNISLATDTPDVLERVRRIQCATQAGRQRAANLSKTAADQLATIRRLPSFLGQASGLGSQLPAACNLTVSSVPGPRRTLYLEGARLESLYAFAPLFDGYALDLTLIRYADTYCFGFAGCRSVLPHLQRLAVYTRLALEQLESAVA